MNTIDLHTFIFGLVVIGTFGAFLRHKLDLGRNRHFRNCRPVTWRFPLCVHVTARSPIMVGTAVVPYRVPARIEKDHRTIFWDNPPVLSDGPSFPQESPRKAKKGKKVEDTTPPLIEAHKVDISGPVSALTNLGYKKPMAEAAINAAIMKGVDPAKESDIIRVALKELGKSLRN